MAVLDVSKYAVGATITGEAFIRQSSTKPPRQFIEGDLVDIMDDIGRYAEIGKDDAAILRERNKAGSGKAGIGTARTRGEVIKKLFNDGFFEVKPSGRKKFIVPTPKSLSIYSVLQERGAGKVLVSPEMTAKWEAGLSKIESGEITPDQFMTQMNRFVVQMVSDIVVNPTNPRYGRKPTSSTGDVTSNCDEKHTSDGKACEKCKNGQMVTMKVGNKESKNFGKLYVRCSNRSCDYFGEFK